jgi:peroxiredoxin
MKKHHALALILALSFVAAAVVRARAADDKGASTPTIGSTIADFKLWDVDGKEQSLASIRGKNGTVLIFISTKCPISNAYNERMEKLAQDYKARGVSVVGINSNFAEAPDEIKNHASENRLTFMILKDKGNKIADQLGAARTPEVFFLDASNKLVYHGRIDNQKNAEMVTAHDLRDAIDATLAGKPVAKAEAAAFGCSIKRAS